MDYGRLILDAALPGPINMARDEAMLESCREATWTPTLRLYAWHAPTISLGYFQDYAEYEALDGEFAGLHVVRRTTGGGAILHDLEVTYSLVIPAAHPLVASRPNRLYELAHRAIIATIGCGVRLFGCDMTPCGAGSQRGPFFCFARRHGLDVVVEDERGTTAKIAGSAQRRTASAILQHGSIMLDSRFSRHPVTTWSRLSGPLTFDQAVESLLPAFAAALEMPFVPGALTEAERKAASRLETRYAGRPWTVARTRT